MRLTLRLNLRAVRCGAGLSAEFQALKAQRASQGSEAWNWQRRVGSEAVSDPEEEEEGDATETDGDTDTAQ